MNVIRSIEISYFRSIYKIRLKDLADLNVFSGKNDAGKSNILKALNLFFNGQTDWQQDIDFYKDFSFIRYEKVREESIKGKQFISVEIEFNRPSSYGGSLPESFKVKRTWYRDTSIYTETNNLEALERIHRLPRGIHTAKRFLPHFLNRVRFEYVPAVKDRIYFGHLLSRLQKTLLGTPTVADSDISQIADNLAHHIQAKIVRLRDDFDRATGIKSSVEPPNEFAALFQSFGVSTGSEKEKVPLVLRGDGIQARYVSSTLQYISESSTDFFIWGFEEPENSLEYTRVVELAEDFVKVYSKNAQIFVTTHSPAFTSLRSKDNSCFRILKQSDRSEVQQIWPESQPSLERALLNSEMGFMQIQEDLHEEYVKQATYLKSLQDTIESLQKESQVSQHPIILTEGKTDTQILKVAWGKLHPNIESPFILRDADPTGGTTAGGAGGADSLASAIETFYPGEGKIAVALFDRDQKGIRKFNGLSKNFTFWDSQPDVKVHVNDVAFAMLIPIPPERQAYADHENLCLEFLFPDSALNQKTANGRGLALQEPDAQFLIVNNRKVKIPNGQLPLPIPLDGLRSILGGKDTFAYEIVPTLDASQFTNFMGIFSTVGKIIRSARKSGR